MQNEVSADAPAAPKGLKIAGGVAVAAAIAVVAIGAATRASDTSEAKHWSDARSIPVVSLVAVKASGTADGLTLPGTMAAWNAAKLYARVGGYVRSWSRDIGAAVHAGEPLGTIDTPELDQQIAQAEAALASAKANAGLARSTAARWNDLLSTHSVSQQEADEKNGEMAVRTAAVKAAEADLGRLRAMKGFATIRTPFAGVVTARSADIGDLVGPGSGAQPLFAVADLSRIRVYVNIPQANVAAIHPGLDASLTVPGYPGKAFDAKVVGASGAINAQSGTFQVQLVTDNPGAMLKPGGYADVHFAISGKGGLAQIPSSALIFRAKGTQVGMVGSDGRIKLQPITLGRDLGQTVEVAAGLQPGQQVVDNPPDSLADGELVRVQKKTS